MHHNFWVWPSPRKVLFASDKIGNAGYRNIEYFMFSKIPRMLTCFIICPIKDSWGLSYELELQFTRQCNKEKKKIRKLAQSQVRKHWIQMRKFPFQAEAIILVSLKKKKIILAPFTFLKLNLKWIWKKKKMCQNEVQHYWFNYHKEAGNLNSALTKWT